MKAEIFDIICKHCQHSWSVVQALQLWAWASAVCATCPKCGTENETRKGEV